ncbi:MAG: hypothetical protein GY903_25590 [Fuerstiella sp.]|nr:hypothetical protein [Fuerstiella sp.]MCP4857871.1 hypothetical protein [Fuerstiella sp.]
MKARLAKSNTTKSSISPEDSPAELKKGNDSCSLDDSFWKIRSCNHWRALAAIWAMQAGKDVYDAADDMLTREYRQPFVVPTESEV